MVIHNLTSLIFNFDFFIYTIFVLFLHFIYDMKLNKDPYKGTRDFYPKDQFVHNHVFHAMKSAARLYGYEEYNSTMLEETALYAAKTGEEIVKEQTYSFTDRGGREVTIRPEMTPTFARMIARKRKELALPARWYSYPNLFRYERPQRGRLREHWQFNVDIAGEESLGAEVELILLGARIMTNLGGTDKDFVIRINSRRLVNAFFGEVLGLDDERSYRLGKLVDKKNKISPEAFEEEGRGLVGEEKLGQLISFFNVRQVEELENIVGKDFYSGNLGIKEIREVLTRLHTCGIQQASFDPTIMRGFDYYTGIVFEFFDTHPENNRSMFGGGRYDDLVGIFGVEPVTCVGFGMGDVTATDFLAVRNLLPNYTSSALIHLCPLPGADEENMLLLAEHIRSQGVGVSLSRVEKKISKYFKEAERKGIPYILLVGGNELETKQLTLKHVATGEEMVLGYDEFANYFKKQKSIA